MTGRGANKLERPRVRETIVVTRRALRGLYSTPIPQMAAALSYRTIFGLIPVLVISLVALKFFTSEDDIRGLVGRTLEFSGISRIVVEQEPVHLVGPPSEGAAPRPALESWIQDRITSIREIPFQAISWIGLATLIYAALSMLVEVEHAFNRIYRAREGRSWTRRLTQYWTVLTLGTIALFATFYVGEQFKEWVRALTSGGQLTGGGITLSIAGFAVTVAISTLLFLFTYTTVPNTNVKFSPALAGAFLAAIAWETGKWGFTQYLHYTAGFERLYGSIALIPLFLLWVYVTWLIVLLGLQVSYGLQHFRSLRRDGEEDPTLVDGSAILGLIAVIAQRFGQGRVTPADRLTARTGLAPAIVGRMLDRLAGAGLILRVEGDEDAYTLARPPEAILVDEVLKAAHEITVKPAEGLGGSIADRLREAQLEIGRGVSLASIVRDG